jgi:transcriptional regulator with XRE-family HTH domain
VAASKLRLKNMSKTVTYAQWSLEPYCIGRKLRALRTQKRLTLARLAAETGLSTALLSKLETERMIPTLPTLATICRVYGVGMSHFFTEPDRHVVSITRKAHLEGTARGPETVRTVPLNSAPNSSGLQAEMLEVLTGTSEALSSAYSRETCGLVYVIDGTLQLAAGGLRELLEAGDCVFVDTRMPLVWTAAGKHACRVLAVRPVKDGA